MLLCLKLGLSHSEHSLATTLFLRIHCRVKDIEFGAKKERYSYRCWVLLQQ